jgi:hypothetical protein
MMMMFVPNGIHSTERKSVSIGPHRLAATELHWPPATFAIIPGSKLDGSQD